MKKRLINILLITFTIAIWFSSIITVKATNYGVVNTSVGVVLRKGPGTNYAKIVTVPYNTKVTINQSNVKTDDKSTGCTTGLWHKITYGSNVGYVCTRFIDPYNDTAAQNVPTSDMSKMTDAQFDDYLNKQGFPATYKTKLKALHKSHPNWVFVGIKARDSWSNILKQENVSGRSLYQSTSSSSQGYLATGDGFYNWYTDKFKALDASTWYQANSQTVAYYMDPRNFLTESGIFMFEDLNYYSAYQTSSSVSAVLYTDFYKSLISSYIDAAKKYNVSPIYLAALTRQEVGLTGGSTAYAINGNGGTYCGNKALNNHYNFYNIQATSGAKPVCNGLNYAQKQGWNTKAKAIVGGASWIVEGYINAGQNTAYFQKWNTSSKATKAIYHQYMSNVRAVSSSASTTKTSYSNMGILNYPFVFQIPIYSGIPSSTSLPKTGNPNNYLKTLKVNNVSVTNFDGAKTSYTVNVASNVASSSVTATTVNKNAKISGTGSIKLKTGTNTVKVTVTAQNGNKKTYTINIVKKAATSNSNANTNKNANNNANASNSNFTPDQTIKSAGYKNKSSYMTNVTLGSTVAGAISKIQKANPYSSINITNSSKKAKTSGSLGTGDRVTISANGTTKTYTVVIYGDLTGDGEISVVDLGKIQKHLLKKSTLTGAYSKSADTDKNGKINVVDLGKVQKHLLRISNISQS